MSRVSFLVGAVLLMLAATGCSRDPAVVKQEMLERANGYFEQKQYREAVIEYRNALQIDPRFPEARSKLAQAYDRLGDAPNAAREFVRAADLLPNDADAQVQAGIFLLAEGSFEDAKARALSALRINGRHVEAQLVLAQALAGLKDLDGAVKQIEDAMRADPSEPVLATGLGHIRLAAGNLEQAEAAFKRAVSADPKSLPATLGVARFYLTSGRSAEAEEWLKKAVALAPDDALANRSLAALYMATNRLAEAEEPLKAFVRAAPASDRMVLVDYYIARDRKDDARKTLDSLKDDPDMFAASRQRLSVLEWRSGNPSGAHQLIDEALAKNSRDAQANLLKGRYFLLERKYGQARDHLMTAVDAAPQLVAAHYALGEAYGGLGETDAARKEFEEVQRLTPREVGSKIHLAQIHLREGRVNDAETMAWEAVTSQPRNGQAHLVLVDVLIAQEKLDSALQEALMLAKFLPDLPDPQVRLGRIYLKRREYAAAEAAFRRAIPLSNGTDGVIGLVEALTGAGRLAEARRVVEQRLAENPKSAVYHLLAARVYQSEHDATNAEAALKSALANDPANLEAYAALSQLYIAGGRLDEARTQLEAFVARQPKAVWAHTMIAQSLQLQNRVAEARQRYERILEIDPRAAVASNNLAMLLLQDGQNLDRALELAQTAKQQLPDDPDISDTLGSVYLQKGLASLAVPPLEFSVRTSPSNADFQYHLGQAYAQVGRKSEARAALQRALALSGEFNGAAEARRLLTQLGATR